MFEGQIQSIQSRLQTSFVGNQGIDNRGIGGASVLKVPFRTIALYALLTGMLLSLTVLQLAFEIPPHRPHPPSLFENIRFWDALVFWVLNTAILFISLWANTRLYAKPLLLRVVANIALYVILAALAITLHYPIWKVIGKPSIGFFLRDEFIRDATMFAVSLVTTRFLAISAEHERTKEELSTLRQANLVGQIESLKQQINPHFFFNSLNTLSGLASEDTPKTIEFIDKLSQVFRTVLMIQQQDLVLLREEIEFAKAYLYLLEVRFSGKFICDIHTEAAAEQMFSLPPLSSQLLLENVVKHNRMTRQSPVHVRMFVEFRSVKNAYFVVENSYQPQVHAATTGIGLANLNRRCEILTHEPIIIEQTEEFFRVKIPMSKGLKPPSETMNR